jgi:putative SOS response-associated peptidase YedK
MCGRYTLLTEDEIFEVREILKELSLRLVRDDIDLPEGKTEVFPTDKAPIITSDSNGAAFENVKWGFKKWDGKGAIINARSEGLRDKRMFSGLPPNASRCVVPAGSFFQWKPEGKDKLKHMLKDKQGNLLFMAGLYRNTDAEREFVILTTEAEGEMREIHDRAPVLLTVNQIEGWLNGTLRPEDVNKNAMDLDVIRTDNEQMSLF